MFGMLDYRAHKAFLLMFGPLYFVYRIAVVVGLAVSIYVISFSFVDGFFYTGMVIALLIVSAEILLALLGWLLNKGVFFIFELFIDVIPHDGRTKEEAMWVVRAGDKAITQLQLSKWNNEDFAWWDEHEYMGDDFDYSSKLVSSLNFLTRLFFTSRIRERCGGYGRYRMYRCYENDGLDVPLSMEKYLREKGLEPDWFEMLSTPPFVNGIAYCSILLVLLVNNPLHL